MGECERAAQQQRCELGDGLGHAPEGLMQIGWRRLQTAQILRSAQDDIPII